MKTVGLKKKKEALAVLCLLGELIEGTHALLASMVNVKNYKFCLISATKKENSKGDEGKRSLKLSF